jgi:molybdopterin-guanine dinucleotide biosynthesis protein A
MDAIVLAGGGGRRIGGADKALLEVGGRTLIDRVLDAFPHTAKVVVVGPPRRTDRAVLWTHEDPPGGGPVAALLAGLARTTSARVAVAAVDHPFLTRAAYGRLAEAAEGNDGAIAVDAEGREQYLVGVFTAERLTSALMDRRAMKEAISELDLARVVEVRASFDIDTGTDLMEAQRDVRTMG